MRNRRRWLAWTMLGTCWSILAADEFVLTVDVPTRLGSQTYLANQTLLRSEGAYGPGFDGPGAGLGPAVNLDALVSLEDGSLLFSTDAPFDVDGVVYEPRDVVRYGEGQFSLHAAGADLGLSPAANVDALARDGDGSLILSLDAPETVGSVTIGPSDLARVDGEALVLLASAEEMFLPESTNVVGLEHIEAEGFFVMFDVPTTVASTTYLPGQIARIDGPLNSLFFGDPDFPPGSAGVGLSFPGSPGEVRDLVVARDGADLELSWQASCTGAARDYSVYEGAIGSWYSHTQAACSTGGETQLAHSPSPGDRYFLVVPSSGALEGSYGTDSGGNERARGSTVCREFQRTGACP